MPQSCQRSVVACWLCRAVLAEAQPALWLSLEQLTVQAGQLESSAQGNSLSLSAALAPAAGSVAAAAAGGNAACNAASASANRGCRHGATSGNSSLQARRITISSIQYMLFAAVRPRMQWNVACRAGRRQWMNLPDIVGYLHGQLLAILRMTYDMSQSVGSPGRAAD